MGVEGSLVPTDGGGVGGRRKSWVGDVGDVIVLPGGGAGSGGGGQQAGVSCQIFTLAHRGRWKSPPKNTPQEFAEAVF